MAATRLVNEPRGPSVVQLITIPWTTDGSGNYSEVLPWDLNGVILKVTTDPGATAPSDNWDQTLTGSDGLDAFNGAGANRDTANSEAVTPIITATDGTNTTYVPSALCGPYTFAIANAGNAKVGTTYIFIR